MVSVIGPLAKYYNLSWGKLEWYVEIGDKTICYTVAIHFQLLALRDQCLLNKFDCVSFFVISPILIVLGNLI